MPTRIRSLVTTDGFLKHAPIQFADGLTCIIGARGTCKSTIVESLRFAFDCDSKRVSQLIENPKGSADSSSSQGLIRATLAGGIARCEVVRSEPSGPVVLSIERDLETAPRVYREGIKELSDLSILHSVEIYSQGELQMIAERDDLRLDLIDRPNKAAVATLKEQRQWAAVRLKVLGQEIRTKRTEIEGRRVEVSGLELLRAQLVAVQAERPTLSRELDFEREAYLKRKSFLERLQRVIEERDNIVHTLFAALSTRPAIHSLRNEALSIELSAADPLITKLELFDSFLGKTSDELEAMLSQDDVATLSEIRNSAEERNGAYYRLRQEQQEVNDLLKREDILRQQVAHLEKLQKELEQLQEDEQVLVQERGACRTRIRDFSDRIYRLRLQQVEQINNQHSDVVVLTLEQGTRSFAYSEGLSRLLQGSRLRNQVEVVRDLAQKVRPSDLIDIVESSDAQRLSSVLSRDLGQMARLITFLMDSQDLYALEGIIPEDGLEITMYDGDTPKPVNQLSRGQMATALLPLILRPADYPLVFDQPEDDLDNRFIFTTLVEQIRRLKLERQMIFVTHNANIPVLGEADSVVVMRMDNPTQAAAPTTGTVDEVKHDILNLLEGGAEAFTKRQLKYGDLLR
jgi:hypothetical protein